MREFDVIIFGATGYTGEFIAAYWAKEFGNSTRWAIGGRSKSKLENVRTKVIQDHPSVKDIPIVVADALNEADMNALCKSTALVINCTGPFRLYGEPVVRSCVANGTHYVDISGEPQFIEAMMLRYNEQAIKNKCVIVSACGFDSVPSDMGTVFTTQQFPAEGFCSSIETFITTNVKKGHATTFECVVRGLAAVDELKSLRKSSTIAKVPYVGPSLPVRSIGYDKREKKYIVKFPGADASIVRNSQRYLTSTGSPITPVRFAIYVTFESAISLLLLFISGIMLFVLGKFQAGRQLMIDYPEYFTFGYFSHKGPSKSELADVNFRFRFYAKGYASKNDDIKGSPTWEVVTTVQGPEPGYVATSCMVSECAKVILDGQVRATGVLTTASAFRDTSLIQRLHSHGIEFKVERSGALA